MIDVLFSLLTLVLACKASIYSPQNNHISTMKKSMLASCFLCMATLPVWTQEAGPSTLNTAGGSKKIAGDTHEFVCYRNAY